MKKVYSILFTLFVVSIISCIPPIGNPVDVDYADIIIEFSDLEAVSICADTVDGRPAIFVGARKRDSFKKKLIPPFSEDGKSSETMYLNQTRVGVIGDIKRIYIAAEAAIIQYPPKILNIQFNNAKNIEIFICHGVAFDCKQNFSSLESVRKLHLSEIWWNGGSVPETMDLRKSKYLTELSTSNVEELLLPETINLKKLTTIINGNQKLDLSQHTDLETLYLECNNTVSLINNLKLEKLHLKSKNTTLDISNNLLLKTIDLECCNDLISLEITNFNNLNFLEIWNCGLTKLDVSNTPVLEILKCHSNDQLNELNLSNTPKLKKLACDYNSDKKNGTGLTKFTFGEVPFLEELNCSNNLLENIDVKKCPNISLLNCSSNKLTSLDLTNNINLEELYCKKNKLTSLDLSQLPKLKTLDCTQNILNELILNKEYLDLNNEEITLEIYQNQIKKAAMNKVFENLPFKEGVYTEIFEENGTSYSYYDSGCSLIYKKENEPTEGNETPDADIFEQAKNNNWEVLIVE